MEKPKEHQTADLAVSQDKGHCHDNSFLDNIKGCQQRIGCYSQALKVMDGAGSHLLASLCSVLAGSQYGVVGKEFGSHLGVVCGSGCLEAVAGRLVEMENLLSGLRGQLELDKGEKRSQTHLQVVCRCLLLFLKLQTDHHQMCSQALSSLVEALTQVSSGNDLQDVLQQMKDIDIVGPQSSRQSPGDAQSSSRQSPTRTTVLKKSSSQGSGSPKTQKHGMFKSSLFSLFERKNSPEEGNSSFYVDLTQGQSSTGSSQSQPENSGNVVQSNQSDVLIQLGPDPSQSANEEAGKKVSGAVTTDSPQAVKLATASADSCLGQGSSAVTADDQTRSQNQTSVSVIGQSTSQATVGQPTSTPSTVSPNSRLATQEELESVINLLSGAGAALSPMQTIPEHQDPLSLQVPPIYSTLSPSASESCMEDLKGQRPVHGQQRRSEGSIDLAGFAMSSSNTWPHPNQHRSSLPGGPLNPMGLYDYGGNPSGPARQTQDLNLRPAMTLPTSGAGPYGAGGYQWAFPDSKLNRTWPMNNLTGSSSDIINGSWSGAIDSDDLSDDSSNCDQFFSVGQDLLQPPMDPRRRVSSDEMDIKNNRAGSDTGRHRSLEDLLDSNSTGTWVPPAQPWSQTSQNLEPVESHDQTGNPGYHRPVQMQWSDPLSSRNVWAAPGLGTQQQQLQSQSVHGFGQL